MSAPFSHITTLNHESCWKLKYVSGHSTGILSGNCCKTTNSLPLLKWSALVLFDLHTWHALISNSKLAATYNSSLAHLFRYTDLLRPLCIILADTSLSQNYTIRCPDHLWPNTLWATIIVDNSSKLITKFNSAINRGNVLEKTFILTNSAAPDQTSIWKTFTGLEKWVSPMIETPL